MVLLTTRTVDLTVAECANVRRICRNCKIVAVLEHLLDEDFQKLAHSAIDGCVPLDVSQDVLTRTLDLVMSGAARIIVLADEPCLPISPSGDGAEGNAGIGQSGDGPSAEPVGHGDGHKPRWAPQSTASRSGCQGSLLRQGIRRPRANDLRLEI